eukprot:gene8827-biopygen16668
MQIPSKLLSEREHSVCIFHHPVCGLQRAPQPLPQLRGRRAAVRRAAAAAAAPQRRLCSDYAGAGSTRTPVMVNPGIINQKGGGGRKRARTGGTDRARAARRKSKENGRATGRGAGSTVPPRRGACGGWVAYARTPPPAREGGCFPHMLSPRPPANVRSPVLVQKALPDVVLLLLPE